MNKNKTIPFIIGLVVIILALGIVLISNSQKSSYVSNPIVTPVTTNNGGSTNPSGSVATNPSTVATTPSSYTLAQLATHNTKIDCWTTINGGVYNVTSWISQHPGGAQAIISLCGIDGSSAFNGQHGGARRPASELATFKIGTLK